ASAAAVGHEALHHVFWVQNGSVSYEFEPGEEDVAGRVSGYSREDPHEFLAEAGLKIAYGATLEPPVMDLYSRYGGPRLEPSQPIGDPLTDDERAELVRLVQTAISDSTVEEIRGVREQFAVFDKFLLLATQADMIAD